MGNDCMGGGQSYRCNKCPQAISYQGLCANCRNNSPPLNNNQIMYNSNPFPAANSGPILSIPPIFTAHPQGDGLYRMN